MSLLPRPRRRRSEPVPGDGLQDDAPVKTGWANRLLRAADRIARMAAIAALLWVGWSTVESVKRLVAQADPTGRDPSPPAQEILAWPVILADSGPTEGAWTFAGGRWSSRIAQVSSVELRHRLDELATRPLPSEPAPEAVARPPFEAFLQLPVRTSVLEDRTLHDLESRGCMIRLVTVTRDGDDLPVSSSMAFRIAHDRWVVVEFLPAAQTRAAGALGRLLLPLPPDSLPICERTDSRGSPVLQVVRVAGSAPMNELVTLWRSQGWDIQDGPTTGHIGAQTFAGRGGESVLAWTSDRTTSLTTLILQRIPIGGPRPWPSPP